ncbi:hypothetical protein PISMIDRAFT_23652 [Pisolithus microcarpus 441]|uniref:Uncharacterized protein n=1 Tax=Pisolithus microcarpus 441 TaxID=765257 RepID=A0A0C9Z978_9AGAM|nr:hypothetical protein BKA83DRAFT_23652 [Pisolithus microcarpus]KIK22539.1 hypothetical protein PISMIDRAFT_23652 [Pisolithus microcarpus 441]
MPFLTYLYRPDQDMDAERLECRWLQHVIPAESGLLNHWISPLYRQVACFRRNQTWRWQFPSQPNGITPQLLREQLDKNNGVARGEHRYSWIKGRVHGNIKSALILHRGVAEAATRGQLVNNIAQRSPPS